jgi:hypothetical protein
MKNLLFSLPLGAYILSTGFCSLAAKAQIADRSWRSAVFTPH